MRKFLAHVWQNSCPRVIDQNALNQSDCRILKLIYLKNETMNENLIFCKIKNMI